MSHHPARPAFDRSCSASRLDREFDRLIPDELRHLSAAHWTPAQIAVRVATLLRPTARTRILDVGSGVGKVCSIGALSSAGTWHGVEHHPHLVRAATRIAEALGVDERVSFLETDAFSLDWNAYDALYLYNPFELGLFEDATSPKAQTERVLQRFDALPSSTKVITLHGFGGAMPPGFELLHYEQLDGLELAAWSKR